MQEQRANQVRWSPTRRLILQTTVELYREIGYRKTTVADIARRAAMSPANIYRFFRSKQEIEEVVVGELLAEVFHAAANAAHGSGSARYRLEAVLRTIYQLHERRVADDKRLNELIATATNENWPIMLSYVDRMAGLLTPMIAAGQARGEIRGGSAATLACCLFTAMDAHLRTRQVSGVRARSTFDEMMDFCVNALCLPQQL